ncbi:Uma2 family endonuclease [Gloeobacter violaceus]|nr:Uma2 family endonuclease [Gloeobacter violaceus]
MEASTDEMIVDIENLVTEDDAPVDNLPSEKQQRLLTEPLYSCWHPQFSFLAAANVGLFYAVRQPPLVPDVFLSLHVEIAEDWWRKQNRSYFFWEFGKPPEVVIEIVSNTVGNERGSKLAIYAQMRVPFYAIYDPLQQLGGSVLEVFELSGLHYQSRQSAWFEEVGLGLTLWQGRFEGKEDTWLRWCDRDRQVIATGAERAEQERQRAEQERQRAEQERQRAERAEQEVAQERRRTEALAERLRQLGIDPDAI